MAVAMKFTIGNTRVTIMDDFCSAPDQAERDAAIKKKIYANALAAIRANPERYYAVLKRKKAGGYAKEKTTGAAEEPADNGRAS